MKCLLFATLLGFFSLGVSAQEHNAGHTPDYCSVEDSSVCVHLKLLNDIDTKSEGHFITHVVVPGSAVVQNLKIDLWMDMGGHGHGSAPVDIITMTEANHFEVKNAWFVMKGTWLVRIDFDLQGTHHHIEIPLEIAR